MTRRIVVVSAGLGQPSSTRLLGDLLYGSTIDRVRHRSRIPLLIVRAST